MFTRIFNYKGNTFFEYDFKGKPFRYIEVRSVPKELNEARWRLTLENDKFYRQIVRNWSECVTLSRYFSPKEVRDLHYHGVTPEGYSLHHVHPRALGGHTLELSNMVLISRDLHDKLHDFMRDFIIAKCLPLTQLTAPLIAYPYANKNESSNVLPNTNPKTMPNSTPPHTLQIFFKHFFTIFLLFMSFIIFSLNRGTFLLFTHAFCRTNNTQSFRTFIGTKNHI